MQMKKERYKDLMTNFDLNITDEEFKAGWHFCWEWDGLLIHKTWPETECCICTFKEDDK